MGLPRSLWRDRRATLRGALYGAGAFLAGYAATALLVYDNVGASDRLVADIAAQLGPTLGTVVREAADWLQPDLVQAVGWFFYSSHYVPLEIRGTALGQSATASVSLQQTPVWVSALVLVPPVVLLAAGYLFAGRHADAAASSALEGGARIALGYAATAAVGSFLVAYSRNAGLATITMQPSLTTAATYCGGYALMFATIGVIVRREYRDGDTEHPPQSGP